MCLGIPGVVVELTADHPDLATVRVQGAERTINIGLLEEGVAPGDCVLIHLGFALEKIDEAVATASLDFVTGREDFGA